MKEVYTLERIAPLMDKARRHLRDLRFYNVRYKHADGHAGYAEGAPYDGILMAASATHVPRALKEQLAVGGRMVLPVGVDDQWLYVIDRTDKGFVEQQARSGALRAAAPGARMTAALSSSRWPCVARRLRRAAGRRPSSIAPAPAPPPSAEAPPAEPPAAAEKPIPTHTVKRGETLVGIALAVRARLSRARRVEQHHQPERDRVGQVLVLGGAGGHGPGRAVARVTTPLATRRAADRGASAREHADS